MKPSALDRTLRNMMHSISALDDRLKLLERRGIEQAPAGDRDMGRVVLAVADTLGISPASIMGKGRSARVAWARQVSLWLCRTLLVRSSEDVARHFGCDASNVRHACAKVRDITPDKRGFLGDANNCRVAAIERLNTKT